MGVPLSQYTDTEAHAHMQRLADETNQYTPAWTTACVHIYNAEPTGKRPPAGTRISGGYESHGPTHRCGVTPGCQDLRLTKLPQSDKTPLLNWNKEGEKRCSVREGQNCDVTQTPNPTRSCRVLGLPPRPTKVDWKIIVKQQVKLLITTSLVKPVLTTRRPPSNIANNK